jgi:predicted SPOUT superfamily RNA methylase MTH1
LPVGQRVTVKIVAVDKRVEVEQASRDEIPEYWGYSVTPEKQSFGKMVNSRCFDLTVATSKLGQPFNDVADGLAEKWKKTNKILVAFGAPAHGLHAIVEYEGLNLDKVVDFVVNTIHKQGTETVRTEEALIASLAVLRSSVFKA